MSEKSIYQEAVLLWGKDTQLGMALEELLELATAILKYYRDPESTVRRLDIEEEITDVEIMLCQLRHIFDETEIDKIKDNKLKRLQARIEEFKKRQEKLKERGSPSG